MKSHLLKINGKVVSRKEFMRHKVKDDLLRGVGRIHRYAEGREEKSLAMSVNPDDIPAMNRMIEERGIQGVHYDATRGRSNCVITSKAGRNAWMKVFGQVVGMQGMHDCDGGYNDP
jgi:hypothetical protein